MRLVIRRTSLVLLFLVAFSVPLAALWGISRYKHNEDLQAEQAVPGTNDPQADLKPLFSVKGPESVLEEADAARTNPEAGKDFLMMIWFRGRRQGEERGRQILVTKYEENSPSRQGFVFGYVRHGDLLKPQVYWVDARGKGSWYDFLGLKAAPREWVYVSVIWYGDRYLGVYGAVYPEKVLRPELKLLGGYELSDIGPAVSSTPLRLGASRSGDLRVDVAQFLIAKLDRQERPWQQFLNQFVEAPSKFRSFLGQGTLALYLEKGKLSGAAPLSEVAASEVTAPEAAASAPQ